MAAKTTISNLVSRHRMELLMWALVAEMLASPLADTHPRIGVILGVCVLGTVIYAARHMASRAAILRTVLPIAAVWMITRILEAFGNRGESYSHLSPIIGLMFSLSILWAIFDHFRSPSGDLRSAVAEAFIGYLVIATAFSQLYWILNRFVERPFNQTIPTSQSGTLLYFSMVTLTSVGYGGITPVNPYVRIVAAMESMSGIFFVAVVVARLVSSYRQNGVRED
jgi:Ion channel